MSVTTDCALLSLKLDVKGSAVLFFVYTVLVLTSLRGHFSHVYSQMYSYSFTTMRNRDIIMHHRGHNIIQHSTTQSQSDLAYHQGQANMALGLGLYHRLLVQHTLDSGDLLLKMLV